MKMRAGADGKVFENESDVEEEKSELNETINRFKQIINY
jgi:ABC-type enterochelin transport system substrate-binding protein